MRHVSYLFFYSLAIFSFFSISTTIHTIQGFYSSLPVPHLVDDPDAGKYTDIPLDYIPNKIRAYAGICQGIRVCQCCDWSCSSKTLTQVLTLRQHDVADIQADICYSVSVISKNGATA